MRADSGELAELGRIGEFGLIARLERVLVAQRRSGPPGEAGSARAGVEVGVGDDGAVLVPTPGRRLVLTTDTLVDGRHFSALVAEPEDWGWKTVAVNVSDVVAMGGRARWLVVALTVAPETPVGLVERLYAGVAEAAAWYDVEVVGGDTTAGPVLTLTATAVGETDHVVRRSGAVPGDRLVVTGPLGAAAAGLGLLQLGSPPAHEVLGRFPVLAAAQRRPRLDASAGPRLAAAGAHAMLDVSDGLAADVGHLAQASGVGVELVDAAVPLADGVEEAADVLDVSAMELALGGGEDYVLAAALPRDADVGGVIDCGRFIADASRRVRQTVAGEVVLSGLGWDHFRGAR